MTRVFPEGQWIELTDAKHPIFHSFFEIDSLNIVPMAYNLGDKPAVHGAVRGQRPEEAHAVHRELPERPVGVLGVLGTGPLPGAGLNEAYKVGINQFIYGITH